MEIALLLVIALVLINSGRKEQEDAGYGLLAGLAVGAGCLVSLFVIGAGLILAPKVTIALLVALAAFLVALLVRKIYSSFFSPQARLQAAYRAMHNRWYDLSAQVVRLEMKRFAPSQLPYELERAQRILARCRIEFERFKKLPPQGNYKDTFYAEHIPLLEKRLLAAAGQS